MICANAEMKNKTERTIVALNNIFSTPLLVLYEAISWPKAPPRPAPLCCNKIVIIKKMEIASCANCNQ